jgi:hypothetical protein
MLDAIHKEDNGCSRKAKDILAMASDNTVEDYMLSNALLEYSFHCWLDEYYDKRTERLEKLIKGVRPNFFLAKRMKT